MTANRPKWEASKAVLKLGLERRAAAKENAIAILDQADAAWSETFKNHDLDANDEATVFAVLIGMEIAITHVAARLASVPGAEHVLVDVLVGIVAALARAVPADVAEMVRS